MIKKGVPVSTEEKKKRRNQWPFKHMVVGDVIDVELRDEWGEAQKYAHTLAKRKKWTIITTWLENEDLGRIRRIK